MPMILRGSLSPMDSSVLATRPGSLAADANVATRQPSASSICSKKKHWTVCREHTQRLREQDWSFCHRAAAKHELLGKTPPPRKRRVCSTSHTRTKSWTSLNQNLKRK